MEWALAEIKKIQTAARSGSPIVKPRWPLLILRTPKGLSGPKSLNGEYIEGSFHSHQVPLPGAKTSQEELSALQTWLRSYKPQELFTKEGAPSDLVLSIVPNVNELKLGQKKESYKDYKPLNSPDWRPLCSEKGSQQSCMKSVGQYLKLIIQEYVSG